MISILAPYYQDEYSLFFPCIVYEEWDHLVETELFQIHRHVILLSYSFVLLATLHSHLILAMPLFSPLCEKLPEAIFVFSTAFSACLVIVGRYVNPGSPSRILTAGVDDSLFDVSRQRIEGLVNINIAFS